MRGLKVFFSVILLLGLFASATTVLAANEPYIVKPGDSLTNIARRYGVLLTQLAAANGLRWNSWVYPGQQITIPGQASAPAPVPEATPAESEDGTYVVKYGDTLTSIAIRFGVRMDDLAAANNLTGSRFVYAGQRLVISKPEANVEPESTVAEDAAANNGVYVVKRGNTLFSIARWHNTTVAALMSANGLRSYTIYSGQRLAIPGSGSVPSAPPASQPTPVPVAGASGEKWIDVNLTTQTVTAFQGQTPVYTARASTGTWATPPVVGTFRIYAKYASTTMSGPGYYLTNVPHTMYLYNGT